MRDMADDWIEDRVVRLLSKRRPLGEDVFFFRNSAPSLPSSVTAATTAAAIGRPIVCFVGSANRWTLLGSEAIVSWYDGTVTQVRLDDLRHVRIVDAAQSHPTQCEWIDLLDRQGKTLTIWASRGEGCLALSGVLQMLIRMRKSGDP
jgi:hypothetical protein